MPSSNPGYQKVASRQTQQSTNRGVGVEFDDDDDVGFSYNNRQFDRLLPPNQTTMMDANAIEDIPHIPSTNSSEELMPCSSAGSSTDSESGRKSQLASTANINSSGMNGSGGGGSTYTRRELFTVLVLCFVNLINYMDRLTIAGELSEKYSPKRVNTSKEALSLVSKSNLSQFSPENKNLSVN